MKKWPVFGLLTAIGLQGACQSSQPVPPPAERGDVRLVLEAKTVEARVPRNATLESLLRQHQVSPDLTQSVVEAVRGVFNPRDLRANQEYQVTRSIDGFLREFRYQIDADNFLRVVARAGSVPASPLLDVEVVPLPKEYETDVVSAEISREHPSLIGAFQADGENIHLPLQLAEIFGGEIDFNSDLQQGDRIDVIFDRALRNGEFIGYGEVKAAVIATGGRTITAVRFAGADGKAAWYDRDGRSMKRQFLKSPLPFDPRVTSRFSLGRLHPVHGTVRPHYGVDYGAPTGTAVKAVASGVVEVAGWSGEAGRMVRIRHTGGYETAYLHLSAFGPGIRPGQRVEQGQLIGRVGSSGTATGPHLDYRILKNNKYVNPLTELSRMAPGAPIAGATLADFMQLRDDVLGQLEERVGSANTQGAARK
jgi:murein DD-endopeptidase MepM/ murein hydrolase activator NlpD